MDKQAVTICTKSRGWNKVDFLMKLPLKYVKKWIKTEGWDEVESAISFQNREFVIACLKPGKLCVVWECTKSHLNKTKSQKEEICL